MTEQWTAEIDVDERLARELIEAQWPALRGKSIRRFGEGWDNSAHLLDERTIFRFPRRSIAVPLIAHELAQLPKIAPSLPVAIPNPVYAGSPTPSYPWPFAGYERLPGETACSRHLDENAIVLLAGDLGRFLRALHGIDLTRLDAIRRDTFGKLRPELLGINDAPLQAPDCVVHGDLYARHLLLDERDRLCGVIDWGDLHRGPAAVDFSVIHMMIPPKHHEAFVAAYGAIDERSWYFARHRARHHASFVLRYATSINDENLKRAAETALALSGS